MKAKNQEGFKSRMSVAWLLGRNKHRVTLGMEKEYPKTLYRLNMSWALDHVDEYGEAFYRPQADA